MKALVVVPDGVSARNFIYGRFLNYLRSHGTVVVLHVMPIDAISVLDRDPGIQWESLKLYPESAASFTLRYAAGYAHMFWAKTRAMRATLARPVSGSWRTRLAHRAGRIAGRLAASPGGVSGLARMHHRSASNTPGVRHYARLLTRHRPSIVFCAHQRPPQILPVVLAARMLGIPTATFIFSWDNLTSKSSIPAPFDHFMVWGHQMQQELLRYYPAVTRARIHVVGSPQFDPYSEGNLVWPREEFFGRIGGDPDRPLICYSGGDHGTCPEDPLHLRILLELVRAGEIRGRPQVLVRPSPADRGDRYDPIRREFPELIYAPPIWAHPTRGGWDAIMPSADDIPFLVNLARYADLNVNMASTMTLDFAINDKPIVNVAFDASDPPPFGTPVWDYYYQFEHYRPVVQLGAARFARSRDELRDHVNAYLTNATRDQEARRRLVELEVGVQPGRSAAALADTLRGLSA